MTRLFRRFLFFFVVTVQAVFGPLAAQQTQNQGFEQTVADNWAFTATPGAYNDVANEDQWTDTSVTPAIAPAAGNRFWYMRDLENTAGGGAFFHTLDFGPTDVSAFSWRHHAPRFPGRDPGRQRPARQPLPDPATV